MRFNIMKFGDTFFLQKLIFKLLQNYCRIPDSSVNYYFFRQESVTGRVGIPDYTYICYPFDPRTPMVPLVPVYAFLIIYN
jgi:hypothetical protein